MLAKTPEPPYFAVIFTSTRTPGDHGYEAMAARMVELAAQQPGFLGIESARDQDGLGITVSYWRSEADIAAWKKNAEHLVAQKKGKETWYAAFATRVAKVERETSSEHEGAKKRSTAQSLSQFIADEVRVWIEQEASIHLRAVTVEGDPVELTGLEARELAAALLRMAEQIGA